MPPDDDSADTLWTWIDHAGTGEWPFRTTGYVRHRRDLSDLASPYLEAVSEALDRKAKAHRLQ